MFGLLLHLINIPIEPTNSIYSLNQLPQPLLPLVHRPISPIPIPILSQLPHQPIHNATQIQQPITRPHKLLPHKLMILMVLSYPELGQDCQADLGFY